MNTVIQKRREELKDPNNDIKEDFLTILLTNEFFKENDELIRDECMTFVLASTQTTTLLISNALYYLTVNTEVRQKLRDEVAE